MVNTDTFYSVYHFQYSIDFVETTIPLKWGGLDSINSRFFCYYLLSSYILLIRIRSMVLYFEIACNHRFESTRALNK